MAFEPLRDLSAADWLVEAGRHEPWERLVGLGPDGYEAYARLRFLPDPTGPGQDEVDAPDEDPRHAEPAALWTAAGVLAGLTSTPDDAYVALWEGWGLDLPLPRFHVRPEGEPTAMRSYHLFGGPLAALPGWPHEPPAFVWPADRAWCVAFDVDPHYAGVAGSRQAVDALLAEPLLDVVTADPDVEPPFFGG